MYCPQCGQQQPSDQTLYCTRCGALLKSALTAHRAQLIKGIKLIICGIILIPIIRGFVMGLTGKSFDQSISSTTIVELVSLILFLWGLYYVVSVLRKEKALRSERKKQKEFPSLYVLGIDSSKSQPASVEEHRITEASTQRLIPPTGVVEETTKFSTIKTGVGSDKE